MALNLDIPFSIYMLCSNISGTKAKFSLLIASPDGYKYSNEKVYQARIRKVSKTITLFQTAVRSQKMARGLDFRI